MSNISAGKYIAKATGIRFIKSPKKGTMGMEVGFWFNDDSGAPAKLSWVGWLTTGENGAIRNTMKTLVEVLGYNGDDETVDVPAGDRSEGMLKNQNCIDRSKEVELVITIEENTGSNGKTYHNPRIKFINNVGGSQFAGVSPTAVKSSLGALGFKAAFLAAKQGGGANASAPTPAPAPAPVMQDEVREEDVPF